MNDDPGVLRNLPRSRPGRRSDKRAQGGAGQQGTRAAGAGARSAGSGAKKQAAGSRPRAAAGAKARSSASGARTARQPGRARQSEPAPAAAKDPVGDALRTAAQLAEAGVKTAAKITGGVLKRLPRP